MVVTKILSASGSKKLPNFDACPGTFLAIHPSNYLKRLFLYFYLILWLCWLQDIPTQVCMFWTSRVTWILNSWSTNWAFGGSWVVEIWPLTLWVSRVLKYPNKCLEGLKFFFMSTWWWDSKNMKEIVLTMAFWATYKIAQPIQPIWQHIFALPWSALKKPPWEFNFFHIFGIPSSSRHEKCCQILQTLFWVFQYSRNSQWQQWVVVVAEYLIAYHLSYALWLKFKYLKALNAFKCI